MDSELLRIIKSPLGKFTNIHLVPREFPQLKGLLKISQEVRNANSELLQLNEDSLNGLERIETEVMRRRNQARYVNTTSIKTPRVIKSQFMIPVSLRNSVIKTKQRLSELLFKLDSTRMLLKDPSQP